MTLWVKLIERMLHPATPGPEADNSAQKLARVLRAEGIAPATFVALLAAQSRVLPPPPPEPKYEPVACEFTLWFGKHRGETLREVAETDLPYLDWIVREHGNEDLVDAALAVIDWFTGGAA